MKKSLGLRSRRDAVAGAAGLKSRTRSLILLLGLLPTLAVAWLAASVHAQIFDPFNYSPGLNLVGQVPVPPIAWVGAGPAGPQQARTQAGLLQWPGLSNSVPNRVILRAGNGPSSLLVFGTPDPADAYPPIASGTIYFSFILRVTDLTGLGAGGNYFAGFTPDQVGGLVTPANVFTRVLLRTSGAGYNIGLVKSSTTPADFQWDTTVFAVGDTVLLVGSYTFTAENADVSQLWINPDPTTFCSTIPPACPPACPLLVSMAGPDATQLASFAYLQRATPAQPTAMLTDELRVSRLWNGVVQPGWDYSDAPPPYRTLFADNGARHTVVPGMFMGNLIDVECDGLPTVPADGDDLNNLDDGDGVTWAGAWVRGSGKNIQVTVSMNGKLDAFFDWNHDGDWADPGEQVFTSQNVVAGVNALTVPVSPGAATGFTYARFRFSTAGGLGANGPAPDGEVEDYRVFVEAPLAPPDLAIAVRVSPEPVTDTSNLTYSVTVTNKGGGEATATLLTLPLSSGITLASATASQGSCSNSAAGVQCALGTLQPGGTATMNVVGIPDFNQLATALNIPETQETISVSNTVSVVAAETDASSLDNSAAAIALVLPLRDFGDAPAPPYPTLLPTAARHRIGALRFGTLVDAELDGQPVNLDDVIGGPDELPDGFAFPAGGFYAGGWTVVNIKVSGPAAYIDMWIDIDGTAGWVAADHVVMAFAHPGGGAVVPVPVAVPPGAVTGMRWARARVHKNPAGLPPGGYGGSGEVVDFQINIFPAIDIDVVAVGDPTIRINEDEPYTLNLRVANKGSNTASTVQFTATLPPNVTAQSATSSNGACQVTASNVTCQITSLAPGQNSLIAVALTVAAENLPGEEFMNLNDLTTSVSAAEPDLNPADNQIAVPVLVVFARDWGDAPNGFPVTNAENGARHRRKAGFYLGFAWDKEADGTHAAAADYDDLTGATPDDEDGITFTKPVAPGAPAFVTVQASAAGYLDAWIDTNGDGDWADAGEHIFAAQPLVAGANPLTFNVPCGAMPGTVFSRWRLSETGGLTYTGAGGKGEVEDHLVTIAARLDFGDAPEVIPGAPPIVTTYEVTCARDGGRHEPTGLRLGTYWDKEIDGQPSLNADLDDTTGVPDDEDGWTPVPFSIGMAMTINVNVAGGNGVLDVWVDWDHNYNWDAPEHSVIAFPVVPGANVVPITVPAGIPTGQTYARFRLSTAGCALPSGYSPDGEVEDYLVTVNNSGGGNPNPDGVNFNGLPHLALGGAQWGVVPNLLSITTTGATGGFKAQLGDSDGYAAFIQGLDHLEAMNSVVQFSTFGNTNGNTNNILLSSVRLEGHGSNVTMAADFSGLGATQYQAFFFNSSGQMVATRSLRGQLVGYQLRWRSCPDGTIPIIVVRVVNGHIVFQVDCVDIDLGPDTPVIDHVALVELTPTLDESQALAHYFVREVQADLPQRPGPIHLNDAVYVGNGLYSATGGASLRVTDDNWITASPADTNSLSGLTLHSGVSDLSAGQISALFDENFLYTASLGVSWPQTTRISNRVFLQAKLRLQPRGTIQANDVLAEFTALESNQVRMAADFSSLSPTQYLAEVYNGSSRVCRVTLPNGNIGVIEGTGNVSEVSANLGGAYGLAFSFDGPVTFTPTGGASFVGDKVVCMADTGGAAYLLQGLSVASLGGMVSGPYTLSYYDRGDAPAAASFFDARHYTGDSLRLGTLWDSEHLAHASEDCTGDDTHGSADEDGVARPIPALIEGENTTIQVTTTGTISGWLAIWMDLNDDGDFADDGEFIFHWSGTPCSVDDFYTNIAPGDHGTHDICLYTPAGTVTSGGYAYRTMRVRLSDEPLYYNDYSRYSYAGECEDYRIKVIKPVSIDVDGLRHTSLGEAALNVGASGVQVSNVGSSRQDGVRMNLAGREGNVRASFTSLPLNNAGIVYSVNIVGLLHPGREANAGSLVLERLAGALSITGEFASLGASAIQIEVARDGVVVGGTTVASSNVTSTMTAMNMAGLPGIAQTAFITDRPDGAVLYAVQFNGVAEFTLPGLAKLVGNELRFIALSPRRRIDGLVRLEIRAANAASFTVQGVTTESPVLGLQMAGCCGRPVIQWSQSDALLEHADSVTGPWNTASNATTGVTVETTDSQKYFRLVQRAARSELAKMLRQAELVFEGTVLAVEYRDSTPLSTNDTAIPHTFVTFAVNRVLKGSTAAATITLRFAGGMSADGRLLRIKSSTLFDVGERSILLVRGNEQYASPLVKWAGGRFRLVDGYVHTENGREMVSTPDGQLELGAWRDLREVRENNIAGFLLEIASSPDVTEDGQPFTPPAAEKLSEGAFRQFLLELIQRLHTPEELQSLTPVSSANSAQPFSVPNPVPRRVR